MKNIHYPLPTLGLLLITVLMLTSTRATLRSGSSADVVLIPAGAAWKYLDDGSNQGTAWRHQGYDDSAWARGHAQLGYGVQPPVGTHTLQALAVDNGGVRSTSAVVGIVVAPLVRPGNDNFADRWPLAERTNVVVADNFFATREAGEPVPDGCNPAGRTVWWSYTAPTNGLVRVVAQGESNAVVWSVYTGAALSELVPVAFSCDQPLLVPVAPGDQLQIAVDGVNGQGGMLRLEVQLYEVPSNDAFVGSLQLEGTNVFVVGHNYGATVETNEPGSLDGSAVRTVWYSWSIPLTSQASFGSSAGKVRLYTGSSLDQLVPVEMQKTTWLALAGTVYHVQVDGPGGEFSLTIQAGPLVTAPNDDFAAATVLAGNVAHPVAAVTEATLEPGEPAHLGAVSSKSLWWRWQAPTHGTVLLDPGSSLAEGATLAFYSGYSMDTLSLVGSGSGRFFVSASAGETYYIAGAAPVEAVGTVAFLLSLMDSITTRPVPGNLLQEPSFEETGLIYFNYWQVDGPFGGSVHERGAADGDTWIVLPHDTSLWQEFPTVPGRSYEVRFAHRGAGTRLRVLWDETEIGLAEIPAGEDWWHWARFTAVASNSMSQLRFQGVGLEVALDAASVVWSSEPPTIVTPPASLSTFVGGTVVWAPGVSGSAPLWYQWFFNGQPLAGERSPQLVLESVSPEDAGEYYMVVTNNFGSATSAAATLTVEVLSSPTIVLQPYGDSVPVGGYYTLSTVAVGSPPLSYQWYRNGQPLPDATNRTVVFNPIAFEDAGVYVVEVRNLAEMVRSLPATMIVTQPTAGGGWVGVVNATGPIGAAAWIYDADAVTRLEGSNYLAQLYAGPSFETLRPVGRPGAFRTGVLAGSFTVLSGIVPTVPAGAMAVAQVRVWEAGKGATYEEARALGGKFGRSESFQLTTHVPNPPPPARVPDGLNSFSLQAGLPEFSTGVIRVGERRADGTIVWLIEGQANARYLVEKATQEFFWQPLLIITNVSGSATFTDPAATSARQVFYRSRILD